ncbi:extracellular solute-binding protein [Cohnella soli]|uniref:Extracellular solute-binding protein n=1 Tax=Cohnella soli TaxID=425005 RepID=A0ABW0HZB8_9BACL
MSIAKQKQQRTNRKLSALLLTAVMTTGMLAGCAGKNDKESTGSPGSASPQQSPTSSASASSSEKATLAEFSYMRPVWGPATFAEGGAYEQQLNKAANVKMKVQIVPVGEYDAKLNTVFASGDLPDVFWASGPADYKFVDMQKQGAFLKINDYLEKYPAIKAMAPQALWDQLKDENGDIFFLPNAINPFNPMFNFYRKDLFEKLSIPEPTTIAELEAALEKIKTSDPKIIPLTGQDSFWGLGALGTSFGFAKEGWMPSKEDPNKLVPYWMLDGVVDFNMWLKNLRHKGLLDSEYLVNKDWSHSKTKFETGKAAVLGINWAYTPEILQNMKKSAPDAKLGILPPLNGPNGDAGGAQLFSLYDRGIYVSSKMKDPDGFFRVLNWSLTEGSDFSRYGVEGKTYKVVDGEKVPLPQDQVENDFKTTQIEPLQFLRPIQEKLDWTALKSQYEGAGIGDMFEEVKSKYYAYTANYYGNYRLPSTVSTTEQKDGARIYTDYLQPLIDGGATLNDKWNKPEWEAAVKKWLDAGGAKIIEEINANQPSKVKPEINIKELFPE